MVLLENESQKLLLDLEKGGAITELVLKAPESQKNIIKEQDYGHASSLLFPFPNRLGDGKFTFENKSYQFPINDVVNDHAIHGFLCSQNFSVETQTTDRILLSYRYDGRLTYYPFPFDVELEYTLKKAALSVSFKVSNLGKSNMPCAFGWHPYFYLDHLDSTKMQLKSICKEEQNARAIPVGKCSPFETFAQPKFLSGYNLDQCFRFQKEKESFQSSVFYPDGVELNVWQCQEMRWVQVFTPEDSKAIAIEPMTAAADAFNHGRGLKILKPNEDWVLKFGVRLK